MSVLEALFGARRSAEDQYLNLVLELAGGKDVPLPRVEKILAAAGRSAEELRDAVLRKMDRVNLARAAAKAEPELAAAIDIERQLGALQGKYHGDLIDLESEYATRREELQRQHASHMIAHYAALTARERLADNPDPALKAEESRIMQEIQSRLRKRREIEDFSRISRELPDQSKIAPLDAEIRELQDQLAAIAEARLQP